jgi:tight adherence protein B
MENIFYFLIFASTTIVTVLTIALMLRLYDNRLSKQSLDLTLNRDNLIGNQVSILRDLRVSTNPIIEKYFSKIGYVKRLQVLISQSGLSWHADRVIGIPLGLSVLFIIILGVQKIHPALITLSVVVCAGIPAAYLLIKKSQRLRKIEEQLPDALDALARAMQAGNSFVSALEVVSRDSSPPISRELRLVAEEVNFGRSVKEGLSALASRVDSVDIRYFMLAVLIHSQAGGNLSGLLLKLSSLIRERLKLRRMGQVLTAEGRLSGWILTLLPFVAAGAIFSVNPEFMSALWTNPGGILFIRVNIVLMVIGIFWMWRIVHVRI